MASALVNVRGVPTPEQFKTNWSQFMALAIAMNRFCYPDKLTLDKGSNMLSLKPSIIAAMKDKGEAADKLWVGAFVKDDDGNWVSGVSVNEFSSLSVDLTVGQAAFKQGAGTMEVAIDPDKFTTGVTYDVLIVFSDQQIDTEVVENAGDDPYTLYGKACTFFIEATCIES